MSSRDVIAQEQKEYKLLGKNGMGEEVNSIILKKKKEKKKKEIIK